MIACLAIAAALVAAGSAYGVSQNIVAQAPNAFSTATYTQDQGDRPLFQNTELGVSHNATASQNGPDGKPLFDTPTIGAGSAVLNGTQYLTAGAYPFICTIHPTTMIATLVVSGNGTPQPRPALTLRVTTRKLAKAVKQGLLVSIDSNAKVDKVELTAKLGKKTIGMEADQSLALGNQVFRVKLSKKGKKLLAKKSKATVKVLGTVPFGAPSTTKRKLK